MVFNLNVPIKILDTLLTDPLHIGLQIDDPKNLFAAENFDVDFPDLSEFFNDLSFNIFSIVDGLAILIDKLADGLKSKFIANLPIIGDNLESFGEPLDRFLENFVQPLQEKLDTIKDFIDENLSEAGLEARLRQFFFDLLGPGSFIGGQEGLLHKFDPNTGDFVAIQTVDELTTDFIDVVFEDPNDPSSQCHHRSQRAHRGPPQDRRQRRLLRAVRPRHRRRVRRSGHQRRHGPVARLQLRSRLPHRQASGLQPAAQREPGRPRDEFTVGAGLAAGTTIGANSSS